MFQRKLIALNLVAMLVLFIGITQNVNSSRAQGSLLAPNSPVGTAFTYQGQLKDASGPVTNSCDFQFDLWDALSGGSQVGSTLSLTSVAVSQGLFMVQLDFGVNAFSGSARWLGIAVRCPTGSGVYNTLSPRQPLTPTPYSLYSANADTVDGHHASAFQQHYQNLLVVAKSGGDFTTITDALNSITNNSPANPFTIYVAPGVYTETVTMKPYVDIEGAGEQATKITFTNTGSYVTGTVVGSNNAELRFLTVESTGGSNIAFAIYNSCGNTLRLTHVTAIASGGWNYTRGVTIDCGSTPTLINVTAIAFGANNNNAGVYSYYSSPTMTNVTASSSGGTQNYGVYNDESSSTMTNVTAFASGETSNNYGVYNDQSSPTMTNVNASASGGTQNYGVYNQSSSPVMMNVIATTWGGTNNYGMWNASSSLTIQNSIINAHDGSLNDGIHNTASSGSYTLKINNSQITGSTSTIYQESTYTTQVGASQLIGAGAFGGTYVCVASYNGSYAALNNSCH